MHRAHTRVSPRWLSAIDWFGSSSGEERGMCTAFRRHFTRSGDRRDPPLVLVLSFMVGVLGCGSSSTGPSNADLIAQGKQTFRSETFGDETKWTDTLRINEPISTVDPTT